MSKKKLNVFSYKFLFSVFFPVYAFVLFVSSPVLAFNGGGHYYAAEAAIELFGVKDLTEPIETVMTPDMIDRDRQISLLPELEGVSQTDDAYGDGAIEMRRNWDWLREGAIRMDDYDSPIIPLHHFWYAEEGLHEFPNDTYDVDNAWETQQEYWKKAINYWNDGDLGQAYKFLGYSLHLMQDMGQPAHANEDLHPGDDWSDDDSLEDWMSEAYVRGFFVWQEYSLDMFPGPVLYSNKSNQTIVANMLNASGWVGSSEVAGEPYLIVDGLITKYNMPQVFYYMYYVNQVGGYFASDDEDGNTSEPIGWLGGFPGFPTELWNGDSDKVVSAQDSAGLGGLYDNDGCDCNYVDDDDLATEDDDLARILMWAYGASFRATPGMIDLFRHTVDKVPPTSIVEMTRVDGLPMAGWGEWNNSPITVRITGATDEGNPGFRPSGVWKLWGTVDGAPPVNENEPSWGISEEGMHTLEYLTTDMMGNVENEGSLLWIDLTPPEISFPDLKPLYLTSESLAATWVATDNLSGITSEYALLDGVQVDKDEVIDLALLAGLHTLEVYAYDGAGNYAYATYDFEVIIDADGWGLPLILNNKSKGSAMFCAVEFPDPYDVAFIDYLACALQVNGTELPAELITGVGDHDEDGIPDLMLRFNKEEFIIAISAQVGDIQAEIWGGLLPDGLPRFVADVTIPVFAPPKKK